MIVQTYLPYYVVAGSMSVMATILFGLSSALRNAGWVAQERAAAVRVATIIIIGWFLLSITLASIDAYRGTAEHIPTIQYGIFIPILIGGYSIWRTPRLAHELLMRCHSLC